MVAQFNEGRRQVAGCTRAVRAKPRLELARLCAFWNFSSSLRSAVTAFLCLALVFGMLRVSTQARIAARHARRIKSLSTRGVASIAPQESDVVIVGGGPAGLALASALSALHPSITQTSYLIFCRLGAAGAGHSQCYSC